MESAAFWGENLASNDISVSNLIYLNMSVPSNEIKNNIIFPGDRNVIFPDNWRKMLFHINFFGKITFSGNLQKISYFNIFFPQRSSFIFCLKNKIIFSGNRNIIFPDNARKIIFHCIFFLERPSFKDNWKKKIWFFVQCQLHVWTARKQQNLWKKP